MQYHELNDEQRGEFAELFEDVAIALEYDWAYIYSLQDYVDGMTPEDAYTFGRNNDMGSYYDNTYIRENSDGDIVDTDYHPVQDEAYYHGEEVFDELMRRVDEGDAHYLPRYIVEFVESVNVTRAYKFLNADGTAPYVPSFTPEVGEWTQPVAGKLVDCQNGYHGARIEDIAVWAQLGRVLYRASFRECRPCHDNEKIIARSMRLDERVGVVSSTAIHTANTAIGGQPFNVVNAAIHNARVWVRTHDDAPAGITVNVDDIRTTIYSRWATALVAAIEEEENRAGNGSEGNDGN